MFIFFDIVQIQGEKESGTEKIILDEKKMSKSIIKTDIQNMSQLRVPQTCTELNQIWQLLFLRSQM